MSGKKAEKKVEKKAAVLTDEEKAMKAKIDAGAIASRDDHLWSAELAEVPGQANPSIYSLPSHFVVVSLTNSQRVKVEVVCNRGGCEGGIFTAAESEKVNFHNICSGMQRKRPGKGPEMARICRDSDGDLTLVIGEGIPNKEEEERTFTHIKYQLPLTPVPAEKLYQILSKYLTGVNERRRNL